jgi:hypothetical protein
MEPIVTPMAVPISRVQEALMVLPTFEYVTMMALIGAQ